MSYTPARKLFILGLAILPQKAHGKDGEGEHIVLPNLSHYFHKDFLKLFNFF
jgi:hypothetical protein